ncbi:hypothetical protein RZS08_08770, partial [Arthrospira platensis SPKY1]|nr:hypothetical protein [Arthrospira platensis SPKY1]
MKQYTYTEARQSLAKVLDEAESYGAVQVVRRNGQCFEIKAVQPAASPLDVAGVPAVQLRAEDIVDAVR